MPRKRVTQAVILIHGLRERRPMSTLRAFVKAVLTNPTEQAKVRGPAFFSKPEPLSDFYDLRTLQNRTQPRTQFMEFYWAHKVTGAQERHIWIWVFDLLWRRPSAVPTQLKWLWFLAWTIVLGVTLCIALGLDDWSTNTTQAKTPYLLPIVSFLLLTLRTFIATHLGDAARYLSPAPFNVATRRAIRANGVEMVRRLHQSGRFDRIIVVGHGLGSVIAYDIIRNFWAECHADFCAPRNDPQPAIANFDTRADILRETPNAESLSRFQDAQIDLWRENRSLGHPWRITDFISIGSPLSHAALLMAEDPESLKRRQAERELPTCPPIPDQSANGSKRPNRTAYRVWDKYRDEAGEEHVLHALHHGAPFAVTRWTNLYFKSVFGIFGDPIAGPLRKVFGVGIQDVAVSSDHGFLLNSLFFCHRSYWREVTKQAQSTTPKGSTNSLSALILALDLHRKRTDIR